MFAVYLAATILGGTLLVASVLTGHHGAGHSPGHAAHLGPGHGNAVASALLSLRFWTYLLAFGGSAGMLLHRLAHLREPSAALLSLGVGALSGVAAQVAIAKLSGSGGGVVGSRELVYKLGTMLLPASPGVSSRVRLTINNQTIDLIATTDDDAIAAREEVLILDIKDGVAQVTRNQPAEEKP